ncbi:trifunctional dihydropteroate synthetase [Blyttiomyces sp. JEL0837]|nr:trifunctional dihydropteroate synthetase [Blyttiomyces sp. JEL0837]
MTTTHHQNKDNMDKIVVRNLQVRNILGVDAWERSKKQPLTITLIIYTDISKSGGHDLLSDSINYGTVTKAVEKFSETSKYRSLEALAIGIARTCIFDCGADLVTVRIEKPRALLHSVGAGVEITRSRKEIEETNLIQKPMMETSATLVEDVEGDDAIFIRELGLQTIIGVNAWERLDRQRVLIDMKIHLAFQTALLLGDRVPKMHNYRSITRSVTNFVENSDYKTVEALATGIAKILICKCHAPKVTVSVRKPSALVFAESAGIEITRDRSFFKSEGGVGGAGSSTSPSSGVGNIGQHIALIAFGSNLGDRGGTVSKALQAMCENGRIRILNTSFLYETSPMYVTDQPLFLNGACKIETDLPPVELLSYLKSIEANAGRDFGAIRNGPRPIDLDIIYYDNLEIKTESLEIPHPRVTEREFVLRPLCDIAPTWEHPTLMKTQSQLLGLLQHSESYDPKTNIMRRVTPITPQNLWTWTTKTMLMGILNVTPDSFSDGGDHLNLADALSKTEQMIANGVDIIDIGGQSTRPNAAEVSVTEELNRVIPVIESIRKRGIQIPISVDTYRSEVAEAAVKAGANFINDVTGGVYDPKTLTVALKLNVPICIMHMRGNPMTMTKLTTYTDGNLIGDIRAELEKRVEAALHVGIPRWNIIVDPGLGFAKTSEQSFELLKSVGELTGKGSSLDGFPILVGPSRKSFLGVVTGQSDPKGRVWATAAACTALVGGGVSILRVHDVAEMKDVVQIADKLYR